MQKPRGPDKRENLRMQKPRGPDNNQQNEENSGYAKTQAPWQSLLYKYTLKPKPNINASLILGPRRLQCSLCHGQDGRQYKGQWVDNRRHLRQRGCFGFRVLGCLGF